MTSGRVLALAVWVVTLAACQFGGPKGSGPSPSIDAAGGAAGADAAAVDIVENADSGSGDDAIVEPDLGVDGDPDDSSPVACAPTFTPAVCDPVCNTGCPALSRCDLGSEPRAGVCIGIWISGVGAVCLRTPATDPCAPRLSCLEGRCRRLCYADGACRESGSCCNVPVNVGDVASGFKACGPCNP